MDEEYLTRAERRRRDWQGAAMDSHSAMEVADRQFWQQASASERLDATWEMAMEAWRLKRGDEPAPRLQGFLFGVRLRGS